MQTPGDLTGPIQPPPGTVDNRMGFPDDLTDQIQQRMDMLDLVRQAMREPRVPPPPEPVPPIPEPDVMKILAAPDTQEVTVTGFAPIHDGNQAQAREEAIADALRRAVEKVAEMYVTDETRRKHGRRLAEEVYAKAEEFIVRYKVLEEGTEGDLYWVRLRAEVRLFLLKERLRVLGFNGLLW